MLPFFARTFADTVNYIQLLRMSTCVEKINITGNEPRRTNYNLNFTAIFFFPLQFREWVGHIELLDLECALSRDRGPI